MKTCSTSNACGNSECCFNDRCWDRSLVSQCLEDANVEGNREVGETCSSDYECASFCCNQSSGRCAVHVNNSETKVLCSKAPGQACISKEWCRKENITECFIVKTGLSPTGTQECALRCYNIPTHGDCIEGICKPPPPKQVPTFDSTKPDCTKGIDPPTNL